MAQDYLLCPAINSVLLLNNKSFFDHAYLVKMAGYWARSFLQVYGPGPSC